MQQLIQLDLNYFCAAHRSDKTYSGVCKNLHGHNYAVRVQITSAQLNNHGFIVDFTLLKQLFNSWIQQNLDHGVIVATHDVTLINFLHTDTQKYRIFPDGYTTSSESIARYLFNIFSEILENDPQINCKAKLQQVQVWETADASAIHHAT